MTDHTDPPVDTITERPTVVAYAMLTVIGSLDADTRERLYGLLAPLLTR